MISIHNLTQGSSAWLAEREGLYTGSNAHKLLRFGKIPYSQSTDTGFSGNYYTKRGHLLEDEAISIYNQICKVECSRPGLVKNTKYPGCAYSPDALLDDRTIEVKAFGVDKHLKMAQEPSYEILAQVYYGQVICEKRLTDLVFYNPKVKNPIDRLIILTIKAKLAITANIKRIIKE